MKTCIRCHVSKPLDEFGNYKRYPDGKHRYCRQCWNALVKANHHAHGRQSIEPFLERFWHSIEQCGHEETCIFCCWPWLKGRDEDGYGHTSVSYNGKHRNVKATHVVYELWHARPVPPGLIVCHYCDQPWCCNPLHLWLGTLNDNRQDCIRKGRHARGVTAGIYTKPEAFARHWQGKLTETQVLEIRAAYASGHTTLNRLAVQYNVTDSAIMCIIHRKTWKHI